MQIVKTTNLEEGMVTVLPVKTKHGQLIVDKGIALTEQLIARISFYGIDCIRVDENSLPKAKPSSASVSKEPISKHKTPEVSYSQRIKNSSEFRNFQMDYIFSTGGLKDGFSSAFLPDGTLNTDVLLQTTIPLLSKVHNSIEMFDMLHNMRSIDDSIYAHSLNVALISYTLGKWLKMSKEDLDVLLLAGLLHDVGKTKIPSEILDKPGKYTDEEFSLVKQHPIFGFELLDATPQLDPRIKNAALMHHERCDGSGYPHGLSGSDIDDFAQIIAIADVYDAMTAARSYRSPLCPFQVIVAFEKEGLQKYKPKFILTFLERIAATYQNNRVLLNDGRSANIIMLNKHDLSNPIIQVNGGECIDLSHTPELNIQALV